MCAVDIAGMGCRASIDVDNPIYETVMKLIMYTMGNLNQRRHPVPRNGFLFWVIIPIK